jgi:uncharacterized protein (TIGR00369 family)
VKHLSDHPIVKAYIANNHFGAMLDMEFQVGNPGEIVYHMDVQEKHLATPRAAHGGAVSAFMDGTMGVCALSQVIMDNHVVSTIEMKISFVSPALLGKKLIGTAKTVKKGKRIVFIEGEIHNEDGDLIAIGSGTFNVYPAAKAGF